MFDDSSILLNNDSLEYAKDQWFGNTGNELSEDAFERGWRDAQLKKLSLGKNNVSIAQIDEYVYDYRAGYEAAKKLLNRRNI